MLTPVNALPSAKDRYCESFPRVSVVMPVYNGGKHLVEAIESILCQTFTDLEVIVVNDGSTDCTASILSYYARMDGRIRIITNVRNLGLAESLNSGIEVSRGDYVARMDADDISLPNRFETQVRFMDAHPEIGVCGSWVSTICRSPSITWKYPLTHNEIVCRLLFDAPFAHPSVIMRRCLFSDFTLRYDGSYFPAEDYKLWSRLFRLTRMANIPEALLGYRVHAQQSTAAYHERMLNGARRIRSEQLIAFFGDSAVSFNDLAIHESLASPGSRAADRSLPSFDGWLRRLGRRNLATQIYPEPFFQETLARVWRRCCIEHAELSLFSSYQFFFSPFAYSSGMACRDRFGFLIRSAQKRFSR